MKIVFKRHWPLLGLGALFLLVSFYFTKSGKELVKTTSFLRNIVSGEGLNLRDIHYRQDDPEEKVKWVLDAKEVRSSKDRKVIRFYDFELTVEPEGKPRVKLFGQRADYYRDSGKIELQGNLKGFYGDKYEIFADHMLVREKQRDIRTNKPVRIVGPFFDIKGKGLFADLKKEKVEVLSDVTTTIQKEDSTR